MTDDDENAGDAALIAAARAAAGQSYSPYSRFPVGAALRFADGRVVTGTNIENASYGLTLCAETVAVASAMAAGIRGGLVAVAVTGPAPSSRPAAGAGAPSAGGEAMPLTPCGRCRQVLSELAQLGGTDPVVLCGGAAGDSGTGRGESAGEREGAVRRVRLSQLLPHAFGPASLAASDPVAGQAPEPPAP